MKRIYILIMLLLLAVIIVGIGIKIEAELNKDRNTADSTTSAVTTSYFAPSTQIYKSPYFQFQTNKTWAEVPTESTKTKFVYRSMRNSLIEHELNIYVQDIPADLKSTHVMPVTLNSKGNELIPGQVSAHCQKATKTNQVDHMMTVMDGIDMLCDADSTQYEVLAGVKGKGTRITMTRPDGDKAVYSIFYRNVTARPEASQFKEILGSFQTR